MPKADVDDLWKKAISEYERETSVDLKKSENVFKKIIQLWKHESEPAEHDTGSVTPAINTAPWYDEALPLPELLMKQCTEFKELRNPGDKLSKTRGVLLKMAKPLKGFSTFAGDVASTSFAPAPVIMVAFTHILGACIKVSEDFDMVEDFFIVIGSFFERLSLLGVKLPKNENYQLQIINVFCSVLHFCGKTRTFFSSGSKKKTPSLRRIKVWAQAVFAASGDLELADAYGEVTRCLDNMDSASILMTLSSVRELHSATEEHFHSMSNALTVGLDSVTVKTKQALDEHARKLDKKLDKVTVEFMNIFLSPAKVDPVDRKSETLEFVTQWLAIDTEHRIKQRLKELGQSYVQGTFGWIKHDEEYRNIGLWVTTAVTVVEDNENADDKIDKSGTQRSNMSSRKILLFTGASGFGKSMLSYAIYDHLLSMTRDHVSVAYFAFSDEVTSLQSVRNMLYYCAAQVAARDATYLEEILGVIRAIATGGSQTDNGLEKDPWRHLFRERFVEGNKKRKLVMLLDGVDQLTTGGQTELKQYLMESQEHSLSIQFILTGPINLTTPSVLIILDKEKIRDDIHRVAQRRVETLPKLSTLSHGLREKIVETIHETADSLLYVDHKLRQFDLIGSKAMVAAELSSLPSDTTTLYKKLLTDCLKHRTIKSKEALERLFCCLAYSKGRLSLGAAKRLLAFDSPEHRLIIGDEIGGALSRWDTPENIECIIKERLTSVRVLSLLDETDDEPEANGSLSSTETTSRVDQCLLGFRERSFKVYFQEALQPNSHNYPEISDYPDASGRSDASRRVVMMFEITTRILADDKAYSDSELDLIRYAKTSFLDQLLALKEYHLSPSEAARTVTGLRAVLERALHTLVDLLDPYSDTEHYSILGSTGELVDEALATVVKLVKRASTYTSSGTHGNSAAKNDENYGNELSTQLELIRHNVMKPSLSWSSDDDVKWAQKELGSRASILKYLARRHIEQWFRVDNPPDAYLNFRLAHQALCYLSDEDLANSAGGDTSPLETRVAGDAIEPELRNPLSMALANFAGDDDVFPKKSVEDKDITEHAYVKVADLNSQARTAQYHNIVSMAMFFTDDIDKMTALAYAIEGCKCMSSSQGSTDEVGDAWKDKFRLTFRVARSKMDIWKKIFETDDTLAGNLESAEKDYSCGLDSRKEPKTAQEAAKDVLKYFDEAVGVLPRNLKEERLQSDGQILVDANRAFQMKARIEVVLKNPGEAIESMKKALDVKTGDSYIRYFDELVAACSESEMWGPIIELLELLDGDDNPFKDDLRTTTHISIHRAAKKEGASAKRTVLDRYTEAAPKKVEDADSGALETLLWSARFYWLVMDDRETAKAEIRQVLNVSRNGLRWAGQAIRQLADILTEDFQESRDPDTKQEALREMEELFKITKHRFGAEFRLELSHIRIPLAIMRRRMGPAMTFQGALKATFDGCLNALRDGEISNDPFSFRMLAKTLMLVDGLEEYARVAVSCQFHVANKALYEKGNRENDGDNGEEKEIGREEQGQDISNTGQGETAKANAEEKEGETGKGGEKKDKRMSEYWSISCSNCDKKLSSDSKYYLCYNCTNCDLCETCYNGRKSASKETVQICPQWHGHIAGPAEGWKGIEDDKIAYGGKEIAVPEWLEELKEKWGAAWDIYWGGI